MGDRVIGELEMLLSLTELTWRRRAINAEITLADNETVLVQMQILVERLRAELAESRDQATQLRTQVVDALSVKNRDQFSEYAKVWQDRTPFDRYEVTWKMEQPYRYGDPLS